MTKWRSLNIIDYPNYEVSNSGKVRNVRSGRILKPATLPSGYKTVTLSNKGKTRPRPVHFLVASAFISNPDKKPTVDHINSKEITNNHVSNLRWATHAEQAQNRTYSGRSGRPVYQLNLDGTIFKRWETMIGAERELGLHRAAVSEMCK